MKNRNQTIDIARGIAIISIILGHLGNNTINQVVYTYHIPVFFLITGYFLFGAENSPFTNFVQKKARNLLVPYYFSCLLILIFRAFGSILTKQNFEGILQNWLFAALYGAGDSYTTPFVIPQIGAIWFLWASFWGCCAMFLIAKMRGGTRVCVVLTLFTVCY